MALVFDVKVVPSSGRYSWSLDVSGRLKCHLVSAPEKGKANKELITSLAKVLRIARQDVEIIAGAISQYKKIKIHTDITRDQLLDALHIDRQMVIS